MVIDEPRTSSKNIVLQPEPITLLRLTEHPRERIAARPNCSTERRYQR